MIKRTLGLLCGLAFLAWASPALAQSINLPANTIYGRLGISAGPGQAIPLTSLVAQFSTVLGGVSVTNPGTGVLEVVHPVQPVTGASKVFATADLFRLTQRSNAGSAMSDTFPAATATGVVNGTSIIFSNVDASATATITAGAGTTINGGATDTVGPGRSTWYLYDVNTAQWIRAFNTGSALLGPNNLSDVASVAAARTNLGLGTIATQNANSVAITGGTITGTAISGSSLAGTISGTPTLSGANFVANSNLVQPGAATLKMNATAGTANSTDTKISALTDITTPSTTLDWIPIEDHVAGTIKKVNAAELVAAIGGGVTSVTCGAGLTGGTITGTGTCAVAAAAKPSGRLTLVSGQPEMTVDVVGAQTIYYAPTDAGNTVPVLVSGTDSTRVFTSSATDQVGLSLALAGSASWAADSIHDVFAIVDSGTLKLATRAWDAGMLPTEPQITNNVTITTGTGAGAWTNPTNAFNGTVNQTSANSATNSPGNVGGANCLGQDWGVGVTKVLSKAILTSPTDNPIRGDAPTSLQIQTNGSNDNANWVMLDVRNINASTNNTSYTVPINQSNFQPYRYHRICLTGNGTNAIRVSQIQFFNIVAPANGRRLSKYNGRLTNDASMTARTGAASTVTTAINEGTFLGVIHIDTGSNGQVTAHFSFGASRTFGIWNAYNQRTITVRAGIITAAPYSYNLTTPTNIDWGPMQGTSTFSMQVLIGYAYEPLSATLYRPVYLQASAAAAGYEAGIGIDNTASFSGTEFSTTLDTAGQNHGLQGTAQVTLPPYFGLHTLFAVEKAAYALGSGVLSLFTDVRNTVLTASWRG